MLGIHDSFFRADDRIHVLKENNPRQNRMRKAGLLRLFMVLSKISSSVKKLLRNNRRFDLHFTFLKSQRFSGRSYLRTFLHHVIQRGSRGVQTAIPVLKQSTHVCRNARIRQRVKRSFALHIAQI